MEFEKSGSFKLPRIGVNEEILRSIEAVLSPSGPCVYRHYQEVFDSLDALLVGRKLPLDRVELDSPAATVYIDGSGVTIHHLPDAHDTVRELQATLLKHEITPLARAVNVYRLVLIVVFLGAWFREGYAIMAITFVVGALLEHVANPLVIRNPLVKLPCGMQVDQRIWIVGGLVVMVLAMLARGYFRQGG